MSEPDDLQKLWQDEEAKPEDPAMWRALIQAKRSGWDELMKAEDQTWYLIALCLGPLLAWAAWKAKYPWVHVGYGLMAVTIAVSTVGTWIASCQRSQGNDRSLRDHIEVLMESYQRRIRLIRLGGWLAMGGLSAGLVAVVMGIPGSPGSPRAWIIAALMVAGANILQWQACRHSTARIAGKRDEAAQLLQKLRSGGQDLR